MIFVVLAFTFCIGSVTTASIPGKVCVDKPFRYYKTPGYDITCDALLRPGWAIPQPWHCYDSNVSENCCASCEKIRKEAGGKKDDPCRFGDKGHCKGERWAPAQCYKTGASASAGQITYYTIEEMCCKTCPPLIRPDNIYSCRYGDKGIMQYNDNKPQGEKVTVQSCDDNFNAKNMTWAQFCSDDETNLLCCEFCKNHRHACLYKNKDLGEINVDGKMVTCQEEYINLGNNTAFCYKHWGICCGTCGHGDSRYSCQYGLHYFPQYAGYNCDCYEGKTCKQIEI